MVVSSSKEIDGRRGCWVQDRTDLLLVPPLLLFAGPLEDGALARRRSVVIFFYFLLCREVKINSSLALLDGGSLAMN